MTPVSTLNPNILTTETPTSTNLRLSQELRTQTPLDKTNDALAATVIRQIPSVVINSQSVEQV